MKKIATLTLGCLLSLTALQAQTFSDDFESYTAGIALGPQSPDWRTWGGAGGGADDANVVTTDNHTTAGTKSIYFSSTSASGGPQDVVLPFTAGAPLNTGQFSFKTWFKVPAAKTAYFNFQGTSTMGGMYVLDCWMDAAAGTIQIQNTGTLVASGTIPAGTWFEVEIKANFNSNAWELLIDGISQGTWSNSSNQVWGIDYYPADAQASFWIDDVSYDVIPYTLPALNAAGNLLNISNGLVGSTRLPAVTVRNLGTGTINSFDISITQNGGAPVVKNVTGLTLASLANTIQTYTTPFTLVAGTNTFVATISNVNGMGADGDATDDMLTVVLNPVTPAAGKMVVAEEATGTWCAWCPRGAVYMDLMNSKYSGYIAPIAVHNGDPMTNAPYDSGLGASSFPNALVDRLPEIDPSAIETDFLSRIVIAPKAFVVNTETYNITTRVLTVTVTTTIQTAITGDYKLACAITEDAVTGTTGYAQSNAYAGGGAGPMGGYELLANPVPASQMVYDHVAREIQPDFSGIPSAFGTSAAAGAVFTNTFTFTLPATYDASEIHIISMFIDPTGKIDNAASIKIANPVAGVEENNALNSVSVYPNPTANTANIALDLKKSADVSVAIYSIDGSLVGSKAYGQLNGAMLLPVDLTPYTAGMYFVNVSVDGNTSVLKLIKK